ncbi:hypothetical protein [Capnocytophaga sp.]|uniref:hypothetical protein n=1 Tax=Capnocytophaga sp. TaxID=44737 RepID=UPI0026DC9A21|nr:hypothetical protein [Capnocytophaga sp.]MDO5106120.1 hypothetical protein [Capnocytophaga sp.]
MRQKVLKTTKTPIKQALLGFFLCPDPALLDPPIDHLREPTKMIPTHPKMPIF